MPIIPPTFVRASRKLTPDEREAIDTLLLRWSVETNGRTVASNIRDNERFLPRRYMLDLIRVLLDARHEPVEEMERRYQKACHQYQLRGGRIRLVPQPEVLGRAVTRQEFVNYLLEHSDGHVSTEEHAQDLVERLRSGQGIDPHEDNVLLTKFTAWVTWNEQDPALDPFAFMEHRISVEVQAALGLDPRPQGPLLLLRYRRPISLDLHRPTIADAGLFPLFNPPLSTEKRHSRTRPWPYFRLKEPSSEFAKASSRPEAVHGQVGLGVLTEAVEQLP